MCSGWNGRRRLAAAPSKADAGSPPWGPAPAFFMPGGGRTAREPYCRLVSSHVTPKLPRLFVRFRRIVPRSDTMRVVMHGYARKRHAKSQLGGIGGGVRPSWHRLAQPCIAVHFSLPQGVAGSNPAGPTEKPRHSAVLTASEWRGFLQSGGNRGQCTTDPMPPRTHGGEFPGHTKTGPFRCCDARRGPWGRRMGHGVEGYHALHPSRRRLRGEIP